MKLQLIATTLCLCALSACTGGKGADEYARAYDGAAAFDVRICLRAEPVGLNPILSVQSISRYVFEQVFQTLNEQDPETLELVPLLASVPRMEEENGTTSYYYTLDSAATWPNGSAVLARDVIFSMKMLMNPYVNAGPYRLYYEMVSDVIAATDDPRSFRVTTKRPYILADHAIADLYIYPAYAYDPTALLEEVPLSQLTDASTIGPPARWDTTLQKFARSFNDPGLAHNPDMIVGSGPYRLVEWEEGQQLRLARRANYWARDRTEERLVAIPDFLTFVIIPEAATAINALRDIALDVVLDMPVDEFQRLREDPYLTEHYDFVAVPGFKYYAILLNQEDALLRDTLTRRALARTVNVEQIIDRLLPGLAQRIVGPVLPTKSYYNELLPDVPYDLDEARRLLTQAGWSDTNGDGTLDKVIDGERREFRFQLLSFPNPTSEAVSLVVAEGARQVGIKVEVVKQEARALINALDAGNFTASYYGQGFEPTPDDFAQVWLSTSVPPAGTNRSNFVDPEADRLIRQIAVTTDPAARDRMYRRFQEIIYANQPMVFLYSPFDRIVVSSRYRYSLSSMSPNLRFNAISPVEPMARIR